MKNIKFKEKRKSLNQIDQFITEYEKRMLDGSALPGIPVEIPIEDLMSLIRNTRLVAHA